MFKSVPIRQIKLEAWPMTMYGKHKLIATDVDGTLTVDRVSHRIYPKVIDAIEKLTSEGFFVVLVSGNSYPVLNGLAKYLGANGPTVAENGCIVAWRDKIMYQCPRTARDIAFLVEREFKEHLIPSWQNIYRLHDYAYIIKDSKNAKKVIRMIEDFLRSKHLEDFKITYSGYALHILPVECGKDIGVREACKILNIPEKEVIVIGDGINDLELFNINGLRIAVSNADEEVKRKADIVLEKPSGEGFVELAEKLLKGLI